MQERLHGDVDDLRGHDARGAEVEIVAQHDQAQLEIGQVLAGQGIAQLRVHAAQEFVQAAPEIHFSILPVLVPSAIYVSWTLCVCGDVMRVRTFVQTWAAFPAATRFGGSTPHGRTPVAAH